MKHGYEYEAEGYEDGIYPADSDDGAAVFGMFQSQGLKRGLKTMQQVKHQTDEGQYINADEEGTFEPLGHHGIAIQVIVGDVMCIDRRHEKVSHVQQEEKKDSGATVDHCP